MGKLKILAYADSPQKQNQIKGKLFETLIAEILRKYGFKIDSIPNTNYAGMEIDVEGKHAVTNIPFYAECKFYENEIDSPKLQAFYGKYMARWFKDPKAQGIFIAIPSLNSHSKGFYKDNIESNSKITFSLFEEEKVLQAIFDSNLMVREDVIKTQIPTDMVAGDWNLIYSDKAWYWVQYISKKGDVIPKAVLLFDKKGQNINNHEDQDYLLKIFSDLKDYEIISLDKKNEVLVSCEADAEEIVEVKGSSACFEYQFPASPEFFVGREAAIGDVFQTIEKISKKETSSRGILFEAYSGWGKSSCILSCVQKLRDASHFAIAIDSRSANSSRFALNVCKYIFEQYKDLINLTGIKLSENPISGYDGAISLLEKLSQALKSQNKFLIIFFDQFENLFFKQEALRNIRNLFFKICDKELNIIFGFSWKTDLIGLMSEFPFSLRDDIVNQSKKITLEIFSENETNCLLDKLASELRSSLRKDLKFFLSEYSQGYPWLLKKLCAHVKTQRGKGVSQIDIATGVLNVSALFKEDLSGLSAEEEDALRRIAKLAPINISDMGEEFRTEIVQPLIDRRLVVRISNKYDIYWDIFRDYLNSGKLPIQENYILRAQIGSVVKVTKALAGSSNEQNNIASLRKKTGLSEKTLVNVIKDVELLGIAKFENNLLSLQIIINDNEDFDKTLKVHLNDRLKRNRLIQEILHEVDIKSCLSMEDVAKILEKSSPYISATFNTWLIYARNFSGWMEAADLILLEDKTISKYGPEAQIRERSRFISRSRGKFGFLIQYSPMEDILIRMVTGVKSSNKQVNWEGLAISTIRKSLTVLESLGFISRKPKLISITPDAFKFVEEFNNRPQYFAEKALKISSFKVFVEILSETQDTGNTLKELGLKLQSKVKADWAESTAVTNAKILMDWAKHANLAPGIYSQDRRGRQKNKKQSLR